MAVLAGVNTIDQLDRAPLNEFRSVHAVSVETYVMHKAGRKRGETGRWFIYLINTFVLPLSLYLDAE